VSEIQFRTWGCRGGRNTQSSRFGNHTSCYSLQVGADLYVLDAGRGLVGLADAALAEPREICRVHVLVTHAHVDHWEGLKDAAWMWARDNGLELTVLGPSEALTEIRRGHEPPAFVPLDVLALGTLARLSFTELAAGANQAFPSATLRAVGLHHYSGVAPDRRYLDTLGYQLAVAGGPRVTYLSDHEPVAATRQLEDELAASSDLVVVDANYGHVAQHAFGHGSIEYAAELARRHPAVWVLAAHHGPLRSDATIDADFQLHAGATPNLSLAVEGAVARWDAHAGRFVR
jgi:phosphoribosyl 1,2-cyclic phosphodiesterase